MNSGTASAEERARRLVASYAATVHIRSPSVLITHSWDGPCYEALPHRIEIDEGTLALPDAPMCAVIAHEVGHATQRRALLLDLALTGLGLAALIAMPCLIFAMSGGDDLWRVSVPGMALLLTLVAFMRATRPRVAQRILALELDADAKAARLCGAASTICALELRSNGQCLDATRLEALRAILRREGGHPPNAEGAQLSVCDQHRA